MKQKRIVNLESNLWPLSLQTDALPLSQIATYKIFAYLTGLARRNLKSWRFFSKIRKSFYTN